VKTAIGSVLGVLASTVGIDSGTGVMRLTLGIPELYDGIDFVVLVIGLFAISEILLMLERSHKQGSDGAVGHIGRVLVRWHEIAYTNGATLRAGLLGFIIGILPGAGASVAGAVAYTTEKRFS